MNWYYSEDRQQRGPVSEDQLNDLMRSGRISPDTLVWREGMTDWQPLKIARPMPPPFPAIAGATTCVECGRPFPADELVYLNQSPVCAQCKPIFLQRLQEGAAVPGYNNIWRSGSRVVTYSETIFPDRCVKCNAPANGYRIKRTLYWMHPAFYLFILCNLLILLIVYLIVRKKAVVQVGLCERHRIRRKYGLILSWSSFVGGLATLITGAALGHGLPALIGFGVLLIGGVTGMIMAMNVTATRIDKNRVWLANTGPRFRESLPDWQGM